MNVLLHGEVVTTEKTDEVITVIIKFSLYMFSMRTQAAVASNITPTLLDPAMQNY